MIPPYRPPMTAGDGPPDLLSPDEDMSRDVSSKRGDVELSSWSRSLDDSRNRLDEAKDHGEEDAS